MQLLVDNKKGEVFDMPLRSIEWKTDRIGKAGTLEAKLFNDRPLEFPVDSGAIVRVEDDKHKIFYGYNFEEGGNKAGDTSIKAYDQLRYLMNEDTFVMPSSTATAAIKRIANIYSLKTGAFEETGFKVPGIVEDGKKAFDVVSKFLDSTLIATNRNFVLYDNFGKLDLREIKNLAIPAEEFYIGDESLLYDYNYKKSIDSETYNRVKFVRDNKKKGKREVFMAQDSARIKEWGLLQQYRKVDENMTDAQVKELVERSIKFFNRETKTFELSCLGDWRVYAGRMIFLWIERLGIKEYFMVDSCAHSWDEGIHTMKLKVKVI